MNEKWLKMSNQQQELDFKDFLLELLFFDKLLFLILVNFYLFFSTI